VKLICGDRHIYPFPGPGTAEHKHFINWLWMSEKYGAKHLLGMFLDREWSVNGLKTLSMKSVRDLSLCLYSLSADNVRSTIYVDVGQRCNSYCWVAALTQGQRCNSAVAALTHVHVYGRPHIVFIFCNQRFIHQKSILCQETSKSSILVYIFHS